MSQENSVKDSPLSPQTFHSALFPSVNFISFPAGASEDSAESSDLDSDVLDQMVDELFDSELNVRQSLESVAKNKDFYTKYYETLAGSSGQSRGGAVDADVDEEQEDKTDFQKYISEFHREHRIEQQLRRKLEERSEQNKLVSSNEASNAVSVIHDQNHIMANYYVPETEGSLHGPHGPHGHGHSRGHSRGHSHGRSTGSPRHFLSKKSFASFKTEVSGGPTKFLRGLFSEPTTPVSPINMAQGAMPTRRGPAPNSAAAAAAGAAETSLVSSAGGSVSQGANAGAAASPNGLITLSGDAYSDDLLDETGGRDKPVYEQFERESELRSYNSVASASENVTPAAKSVRSAKILPNGAGVGNGTEQPYALSKKLTSRHLQMIAFSGTLGVGLYLSASKNFSISGPLGALLGFSISGTVVLCTMLSLCEMITFIPLVGGISGIGSRFVDDALGFAAGFVYWINYTVSLPSEITAGTIMLSYYDNIGVPGRFVPAWISFFLVWTVAVNLMDVRVYGELEFVFSWIKIFVVIFSSVLNIVINTGGMPPLHEKYGFKFWRAADSEPDKGLNYGLFRPTFDLRDTGYGATEGIPGATGRFLSLLVSTCIAGYAYVGTEIVVIVAAEAKNPRKALPKATNRIFWRILVFYVLAVFCVSLNVYSGDPRLLRYRTFKKNTISNATNALRDSVLQQFDSTCMSYYDSERIRDKDGWYNGSQSPWIIALQNANQCTFSAVFNGVFVMFALSAGSSQLYASSRTLYQMAVQGKAPAVFSKCSKHNVPYVAVLFSGSFGTLAFLCVNHDSNYVFQRLMTICSTSGEIVWVCMCLSFIRYYYGLKHRTDLISRNDKTFPYKSPFQPFLAYFGLVIGLVIILCTGVTSFFKGYWSSEYFFTSYGSLIIFLISYFGYKFVNGTKILRVDQIQLDVGRKEDDTTHWEETKAYNLNFKERFQRVLVYCFG